MPAPAQTPRTAATASGPARRGRPSYGLFHAAVPAERVSDVAALEWVAAITTPDYGQTDDHPTNPTNSQGVALHNADDVQTRGINGAGVNVGVISNGVPSLAASDLPAVTVNNTGCAAGSPNCDEGTAMLEIVHDMAPGAGLLFDAGSGGGTAGHVGAQNWLAANGANVITEDLAFDAEPAFQYGLVASNGDTVAAGGGSICRFDGMRFRVGPESAGADPGPACYRKGGPLTVTDCNLFLRRIDRILFAATKADHLHHTSHDRLQAIMLRLVGESESHLPVRRRAAA